MPQAAVQDADEPVAEVRVAPLVGCLMGAVLVVEGAGAG